MTSLSWAQRETGESYKFSPEDNLLLDKVQQQTLKYFTDSRTVNGMARDRSNGDDDVVVTGGTGFGIMAMIAGASRGWLTREKLFEKVSDIVRFLKMAQENNFRDPPNKKLEYHGMFPHYLNGNTGAVYIFPRDMDKEIAAAIAGEPDKDKIKRIAEEIKADIEKEKMKAESGDIVETSFLMMGLLTARQYFLRNERTPEESQLCDEITALYKKINWSKHLPDNQSLKDNELYWLRHPESGALKLPIQGWNECLLPQILAAGGEHGVSPEVYRHWVENFPNHNLHYGDKGGPAFFTHYSFIGLDPRGLADAHGNDFFNQNQKHFLANWEHCIQKYGPGCAGLTACDLEDGYGECYPNGRDDHIAPNAAISSIIYDPKKALEAIRYFMPLCDNKGRRVWREGKDGYGFAAAFKVDNEHKNSKKVLWCAEGHVAIDQGPIVGMIENARTGLLWNLFMGCPEVQDGLQKLGFQSPHINNTKPDHSVSSRKTTMPSFLG